MLQCREKRFFSGSYGVLSSLSSVKYCGKRCTVEKYNAEKNRWVCKLWGEEFNGDRILVREQNITFDSYGVPCEDIPKLPSHLKVRPTLESGNGLFCDADWQLGQVVMEENPFMVVANRGGDDINFEARWNLIDALETQRGSESHVLAAFQEMSDGGDHIVKDYIQESKDIFQKKLTMSGSSRREIREICSTKKDFVTEEIARIAKVIARWQTNSHDFATVISEGTDQCCLFLWASRMQHSCEPNCHLQVDTESGCCIIRAIRHIEAGDEMTNDYTNGDPEFHALNVKERQARLMHRGFLCKCSRCKRESGM
jgi:hypothetical protein